MMGKQTPPDDMDVSPGSRQFAALAQRLDDIERQNLAMSRTIDAQAAELGRLGGKVIRVSAAEEFARERVSSALHFATFAALAALAAFGFAACVALGWL